MEQAGTHLQAKGGAANEQHQARTDPGKQGGMAAPPAWPLGSWVHLSPWLRPLTLSLTEPSAFHCSCSSTQRSPLSRWSCLVTLAHIENDLPKSPSLITYPHSNTSCDVCPPYTQLCV